MTIQPGTPDARNHESAPTLNVFLADQNVEYSEPSAKSAGVSFPPNVTRFVMTTTLAVLGTYSTPAMAMKPLRDA